MKIQKANDIILKSEMYNDFKTLFSIDIEPYIEVHLFKEKETIHQEGEPLPYLYYLGSGKAKVFISQKNGKISLIGFVEAPSIMGEMGLLGVETNTKGIIAITECVCLAIPILPHRTQLLQDSRFLLHLSTYLGERIQLRTEKYATGSGYPFENRLAAYILKTEINDVYLEKHTEVAEYLNISYRHLLYVLNQFCKKKWLRKVGRKYVIQDREQLLNLADEVELY
jgi:CRP-like cAMP-binding protein